MSRHEFSRKTRRLAWERANGVCEGTLPSGGRCYVPLHNAWHEFHHIDPDWISSNNELDNCAVLCRACHVLVTKQNKKDIAKIKRIRDKASGALKSRRGFKSWRRFSGELVWRNK